MGNEIPWSSAFSENKQPFLLSLLILALRELCQVNACSSLGVSIAANSMNHLALSYMQPWSGFLSFANGLTWPWEEGRLWEQEDSLKAGNVDKLVPFIMALEGYGAL